MKRGNDQQTIKSLREFIEAVFKKNKNLGDDNIIWFRGENSSHYQLVPTLYRKAKGKYCFGSVDTKQFYLLEQNIDTRFFTKSFVFLASKGIENTPWNRYFLKQHYGIKTRLLDWTENALYALFFAIQNPKDNKNDARVWILSPFSLNNYSVTKLFHSDKSFRKILTLSDFEAKKNLINEDRISISELSRKYYRLDCEKDEELYPLAFLPPHLDQRMAAQQSCFTLFGNIVRGLHPNDSAEAFLEYIDIDANSKQSILKELSKIGITSYSVFPDLDGLGKAINEGLANDIDVSQNNSDWNAFFTQVD